MTPESWLQNPKMRKNTTHRSLRGFTLVELLMVILVIGLVTAFSAQSSSGTLERLKIEQSANAIVAALKYARIIAIERQTYARLKLDETSNTVQVIIPTIDPISSEIINQEISGPFFKSKKLNPDIKFSSMQAQSNELSDDIFQDGRTNDIVFKPDGTCDNTLIIVGNDRFLWTIRISPATGKIKVSEGTPEQEQDNTVIDLDAI